ncbi:MAG: LpxL/LpxP family Kdo(2)-lipid IV(A) lauroyl/palmitoleoyl acyltransferase [Pseudomonadota bacterium]|nr:LpxL/LpxP family Kdo(2)-lipid IV(A) lauroyl/palmitoleoyl acyltransferase [Pseudomonadota bacterium]
MGRRRQALESRSQFDPRFWPLWALFGVLWLSSQLPYRWQLNIGRFLGRAAYYLAKSRRHVARRNLELCLPELSASEREQLLKRNLESLGMGLIETTMSWWAPDQRVAGRLEIEGLEHLRAAQADGRGVILLSAHFSSIDICGRLLGPQVDMDVLFRRHENPVIERFMRGHRERMFENAIPRDDIRTMIRHIKQGRAVWYAPDQNHRGKNSAMVPFFGVPASTNTATPRLAKMTHARVLPFLFRRDDKIGRYYVRFYPPVEDFPTDDPLADTTRVNQIIEELIRQCPEQYFWVHQRFKKRPPEYPDAYA